MEKNQTGSKPMGKLQDALGNIIDARLNLAKSILGSIQSSIEGTSNNIKDIVTDDGENSVVKTIASAIVKRAKAINKTGDALTKATAKTEPNS
jgi:hypothetical protein